jgi:DNA polymerase III delta prime subunit
MHISSDISASYIIHGHHYDAVSEAAKAIIKRVNCLGDTTEPCANCRRLANGSFVNVITLAPGDRPTIGIEPVRTLIKTLSLSTAGHNQTRIVCIEQAQTLTLEAQNALLKLIEEPPNRTIVFLLTTEIDKLLATVRSRCQEHFITGMRATQNEAASKAAHELLDASPYKRLIVIKQNLDAKTDPAQLAASLQAQCLASAEQTADYFTLNRRLQALERFRSHLASGVTPRSALERLTLDL